MDYFSNNLTPELSYCANALLSMKGTPIQTEDFVLAKNKPYYQAACRVVYREAVLASRSCSSCRNRRPLTGLPELPDRVAWPGGRAVNRLAYEVGQPAGL